jgi:lysophospholipase L1-like esterase
MEHLSEAQLEYLLKFHHPEKRLAGLPGLKDHNLAPLFGIGLRRFRSIHRKLAREARAAALALLDDPGVGALVDALPFRRGATVVGLGDSITDDDQSWLELLRLLLDARRPDDGIRVVNAGVSGDTTSQMISRFLAVVNEQPDWVVCMAGTNDTRLHGLKPSKVLVSADETERNLAMLRNFARTQTSARWVWMTPAPVLEDKMAPHWFLGPMQMAWKNRDLRAVADIMKRTRDPVVDLQAVFGDPPHAELLLDDGLHPSLDGQAAILRALLDVLGRL